MEKNFYNMEYTIGITTFSKRYDYVVKLISQIRDFTDKKIILAINGEKDGQFNDKYRQKILQFCSVYENVYPIFFIETRGLCKLWNTIMINSSDDNLLILNDDLEILSDDIFKGIDSINTPEFNGLTKVNSSFSHFFVSKNIMSEIGYFDERLLGFGEEDGDVTYRLLKKNVNINSIFVNGVVNIVSEVRHDHIKAGIGKYSMFNREFIYNEKYKKNLTSPYKGMFDTPMEQILEDTNQYPYEKFFKENKDKL